MAPARDADTAIITSLTMCRLCGKLTPCSPSWANTRPHSSKPPWSGVTTRPAFSKAFRKLASSVCWRLVRQPANSSIATTELIKNCGRRVRASNSSLWFGLRKKSMRTLVSSSAFIFSWPGSSWAGLDRGRSRQGPPAPRYDAETPGRSPRARQSRATLSSPSRSPSEPPKSSAPVAPIPDRSATFSSLPAYG